MTSPRHRGSGNPPPHRCRTFPLLHPQIGVWVFLRLVSVAQANGPLTTLPFIIHRPPDRVHGLTVVDDETLEWLLNTCPEI